MSKDKIKLTTAFSQAYQSLNSAQKSAVDRLQGPVAVFAGPGTGKTQIIATRIARILSSEDTQASPSSILCLTFTDAGAIAMRQRLLQMIGPDAHKVPIYTFHGFCNQVIARHPDYFGMRDLKAVTEIEVAELMQQLLTEIKPGSALYTRNQDTSYLSKGLLSFFQLIKKEDLTPSQIIKEAEHEIEFNRTSDAFIYKRNGNGFKKGDFNEKKFKEAEKKLKKVIEAARLFDRYNALLANAQRFDFHDMIAWVIRAFEQHETLLLRYKEQFLYFLADEYQDSNGSQIHLLRLLTDDPDGQPNVFVVGDGDQAIYRFQGAESDNLFRFEQTYATSLHKVMLEQNYRSVKSVLQAAYALMAHQSTARAFPLAHTLEDTQPVYIWTFENRAQETAGIVALIESLLKKGIRASEIAVIYRNHAQADRIIQSMQHRAIPFHTARPINILTLPETTQLLTMLRFAVEEMRGPGYGEYLIYEMMHYKPFGIHPHDAAVFARYCATKDTNGGRNSWRIALQTAGERRIQGIAHPETMDHFNTFLNALMLASANCTIQELFGTALKQSGILGAIMRHPERTWLLEVVTTLFDFIKEETSRKPEYTLANLLDTIDKMNAYGIALNATKLYHAEDGVKLLTAHSSKGLEFEHVFVIGAEASQWEKKRSMGALIQLPEALQPPDEEEREKEERRLFYVAVTRAKKHLILSYSEADTTGKPLEASRFISELETASEYVVKNQQSVAESDMTTYLVEQLSIPRLPLLPLVDKDPIRSMLQDYRLSVTHLNKYLRCPLSFYFENVLKIPEARNAASGFGSAIHKALEEYYKAMKTNPEMQFEGEEALLTHFKEALQVYKSHFPKELYTSYQERGTYALSAFHRAVVLSGSRIVLTEYRSDHLSIADVPVSGMLDKLEFNGEQVTVVDYKTGRLREEKLLPPGEKSPKGGDYWRQMVFYKLLIDADRYKNWNMTAGRFDFVEPDAENNIIQKSVELLPEYLSIVKKQVSDTYQSIMQLAFEHGCGEPDCRWCTFAASQYGILPKEKDFDDY